MADISFSRFELDKFSFDGGKKREELVYMARVAEQAERYCDMCSIMRALVQSLGSNEDLSVEERKPVVGGIQECCRQPSCLVEDVELG